MRNAGSEFQLIDQFFSNLGSVRPDVSVGVGDDCAVTKVPPGHELAVSVDTLVAGVHFFPDARPHGIGYKSLAVGLSDLAAVGAEPAWATLALTLPTPDQSWLRDFSVGLSDLATQFGLRLIGGDLTRGPLTISIQVMGFVPEGRAIRRRGAAVGDAIVVSGQIGDAGLALRTLQASSARREAPVELAPFLRNRLEYPTPRVALGLQLREIATAAIDVSDGLGADLGHLLETTQLGAEIDLAQLPLGKEVQQVVSQSNDYRLPISSGDDYELCFTIRPDHLHRLETISRELDVPLTVIGKITETCSVRMLLPSGDCWPTSEDSVGALGFDHFSGE